MDTVLQKPKNYIHGHTNLRTAKSHPIPPIPPVPPKTVSSYVREKPKKFGGAYASDEKKSDQGAQEVVTMSDLKNIWGI